MTKFIVAILLLFPNILLSQNVDTVRFSSDIFKQEREIIVHTPEDYKYQSELVELPVIYVLDGQHEWFVNPILNNLTYLKYTYEIPNAIIVVIPHDNRYKECAINEINSELLPLHQFITTEVEAQLSKYNPNKFRLLIGHSFSASFALYSFLKGDGFYSAVYAHSPLNQLENLVKAMQSDQNIDLAGVYISVGSSDHDKDLHHRAAFDHVQKTYPDFFSKITTYTADLSTHNAVPIVSNPIFLSKLFYSFSRRFGKLAQVNSEYKLTSAPDDFEQEITKFKNSSLLGEYFYAPEIGEIFGLASRYANSGYQEHTLAVYQEGLKYYPKLYDLHLSAYELLIEKDNAAAKQHLFKVKELIEEMEKSNSEALELLPEIENEIQKNGW